MSKCPEKEKLSLFVDGELEKTELVELDAHIKSCDLCRKEIAAMTGEEKILREGIDEIFAGHRVAARIMDDIRKNSVINKPVSMGWWRTWFLLPALAVALIAVAFLVMPEDKHRFHTSIMFHALAADSTVDGIRVQPDQPFELADAAFMTLKGKFLFSVAGKHHSEFVIYGQALAGISEEKTPEFKNADFELSLVRGKYVKITVNEHTVTLCEASPSYRAVSEKSLMLNTDKNMPIASETLVIGTAHGHSASATDIRPSVDHLGSASATPILGYSTSTSSLPADITVASDSISSEPEALTILASEPVADPGGHISNPFVDRPIGTHGN